ncbi:hypothetical protein JKP88DRAFT_272830 [Tribonema minus]|uniref:Uncharacterized protein n=1 Tax=Tribonema minus TaxID=303371 RepID=A0A836CDW6_9STRA|nr:hypothetical protein JKP88DRAFT_272830 [Tribonema minus]
MPCPTARVCCAGGAISNHGDFTCSNSTFDSNTSGYDGGGAINNAFGDFTCSNSIFTNNTADDGGAISSNYGESTCSNSTFDSNAAAIKGGAVYAVARSGLVMSWVAIRDSDSHEDGAIFSAGNVSVDSSWFEHNSGRKGASIYLAEDAMVSISGTSFSFNNATETGGALYLEAFVTGHIDNCRFLNNTSPVGGALSLASADDGREFSVFGCNFTGNTASVGAGGAIIQQGSATVLSVNVDNGTFVNNTAPCCYTGTSNTGDNMSCEDASTGYGTGWSCCNEQQYLLVNSTNGDHTCETCDKHELNCTAIGLTVATLPVASGYWRETIDQTDIRTCWNTAACKGGDGGFSWDTADVYCNDGYMGPYCAVCAPGYARLPGYRCVECSHSAVAATITILAAIVLVALALLWLLFSKTTEVEDGAGGVQTIGASGRASKLARVGVLLLQRLRIPVVVLQVLTQYISITGLTLPLQYLQFLRAVDFMSLDMRWLTSPGCAADVDFYGRLLIATLAPLVITALIFSPRLYLRFISRRRPAVAPKLRQVVARDVNAFLVFTFLIFSGVSLTVFETFACDKHLKEFTGDIYLHADYSLRCNDDEGLHKKYSIYAGFMVVVYPVGIPLMYAAILRQAAVKQREHGRQPSRLAPASSFLWSSYKGRAYYWESVECYRRLMLSGLLVFIMPGTPGQSAVACIFAFVTTMVYEQYHPVDGGSEQAIGSLLIALNVLMLVMAIAQVALVYTNVRAPDGPLRQNSVFAGASS